MGVIDCPSCDVQNHIVYAEDTRIEILQQMYRDIETLKKEGRNRMSEEELRMLFATISAMIDESIAFASNDGNLGQFTQTTITLQQKCIDVIAFGETLEK